MKRIYKYPLSMQARQVIPLPLGSTVLCVQTPNEEPHIWAMVHDDVEEKESRVFLMVGTGHPMPDTGPYIGTFQLNGGAFVFHLFYGWLE